VSDNISPATATIIPSLPYTITQDVLDVVSLGNAVYYKYVALPGDTMVGVIVASDDRTAFFPEQMAYWGDTTDTFANGGGWGDPGEGIEWTVNEPGFATSGTLLIEVSGAGTWTSANLTLKVDVPPRLSAAAGSLVFTDWEHLPLVVLSAEDGSVLRVERYLSEGVQAATDMGTAVLATGEWCAVEWYSGAVLFYSSSFGLVTRYWDTPFFYTGAESAWCQLLTPVCASGSVFYIASYSQTAHPTHTRTYGIVSFSATGTLLDTWVTPNQNNNNAPTAIAVSPDQTVLYATWGQHGITQYDLIGETQLADLVAARVGYSTGYDCLIVLDDGSVVTGWTTTNYTGPSQVRRYNPTTGNLINEIEFDGMWDGNYVERYVYSLCVAEDGASFWVRHYRGLGDGLSDPPADPTTPWCFFTLHRIRASDMAVLESFTVNAFDGGVSNNLNNPSDVVTFGPGITGGMFVLRQDLGDEPQYARPIADVAINAWTPSSGVTLYPMVNEVTPDDGTFIRSPSNPVNAECELTLNDVEPFGTNEGDIVITIRGTFDDT